MKVKVYPTSHDPMLNMFYTYNEAVELFGEPDEFELTEDYIEIPKELADRFLKAKKELFDAEEELSKIFETKGKSVHKYR